PRAGYEDDDYRRLIRAEISVLKSHGRYRDLGLVAQLVIDDANAIIEVDPQYPASLVIRATGVTLSDELSTLLVTRLLRAVAAGVRLLLEYQTQADADTFAFDGSNDGAGFGV